MAARLGRKVVFTWNGAAIEGVREKGIAFNGEPVDITDENSNGMRELLAESGENSMDVTLGGLTKSQVLKKAWMDGLATPSARVGAVTITYPDGGVITVTLRLNNYSETEPYKDATTFQAQLQSSGSFAFTPGS
jgi:predicted secreted protein